MVNGKTMPITWNFRVEVGHIVLSCSTRAVDIVAGGKGELHILEDNSPLDDSSSGTDISKGSTIKIDGQRLYNLIENQEYGNHQIAIEIAVEISRYTLSHSVKASHPYLFQYS